jgi:site-specific DNA-methyltransferase (cytosine-N4-specific)
MPAARWWLWMARWRGVPVMSEGAALQLDLFAQVAAVYADAGETPISNSTLYASVAERAGIEKDALEAREPIGQSGQRHSRLKRAIRWHQQTLKEAGVLEHADARGVWRMALRTGAGLHEAAAGVKLVAFSTRLGVAVWGDCADIFARMDEPISLAVTSPPFPLRKPRSYGGPVEREYVDFICVALEPIVRRLAQGGSLCLNISNDIFEPGLPSRSMYCERLLLALHDRLGLSLMDRLIWSNPSKPPGPMRWASQTRQQLNTGYEPIYWLAPNPALVRSDNRRVLEPHTQKHAKLIAAGGEKRHASYSDGAYRIHPGRFGKPTAGRIPRNVITRGHRCADAIAYRRDAAALGLPVHGAGWPLSIPDFLIRFLTEPGDLVVDPFGGRVSTGMAAERLGRRWIVAEKVVDYLRGAAPRFAGCDGFSMGSGFDEWRSA